MTSPNVKQIMTKGSTLILPDSLPYPGWNENLWFHLSAAIYRTIYCSRVRVRFFAALIHCYYLHHYLLQLIATSGTESDLRVWNNVPQELQYLNSFLFFIRFGVVGRSPVKKTSDGGHLSFRLHSIAPWWSHW